MRWSAHWCVGALLAAAFCAPSGTAAPVSPLGVIIQAGQAHLDSVNAVIGTNVYAGDVVDTEDGGVLRLQIGATQVYLSSSSAAKISQGSGVVYLVVGRGTVAFSSQASGPVALETPAGILRGTQGQPAFGQAQITGPRELIVSAFRGNLVFDNGGELHAIPEGKTYRVVIQDDMNSGYNADDDYYNNQNTGDDNDVHHAKRRRKLLFFLLFGSAAAFASYTIWYHLTESSCAP